MTDLRLFLQTLIEIKTSLTAYCLSVSPPPRHVIDTRQLVEVRSQYRPIILCWFPQTIAAHELINLGGAVKHGLHITRRRLMMIEMIMQRLRLLIEFFDESVYVILAPRTVEAALVQRRVQILAKDVGLMLDTMMRKLENLKSLRWGYGE